LKRGERHTGMQETENSKSAKMPLRILFARKQGVERAQLFTQQEARLALVKMAHLRDTYMLPSIDSLSAVSCSRSSSLMGPL